MVWHRYINHFIGQQTQIPIHPSKCQITQLKIDKNRKAILERKKRVAKDKHKHREAMEGVE